LVTGWRRTDRVSDLLKREISQLLLRREVKDPGIPEMITITAVEVSADLRHAQVFYSLMGGIQDAEQCQRALVRASPFIRRRLGRVLRIKRVPELIFRFDRSIERGVRLIKILDALQTDRGSPEDSQAD